MSHGFFRIFLQMKVIIYLFSFKFGSTYARDDVFIPKYFITFYEVYYTYYSYTPILFSILFYILYFIKSYQNL